ncbi:ABC transporter permease subunit [Radiobacillus sp. PE A8.2]|uniref:ABC transporter permease subunit n=1 Tax=Radiobacillus sp. PE A8.2 TaxID=3380349 RepID=UPI00388E4433
MKIVKFLIYYLLGVLGIFAISNAPMLLTSGTALVFTSYISDTVQLIKEFFQFNNWTYTTMQGQEVHMLSQMWDPYLYSMKLFLGAILLGVTVALVLGIITLFLPRSLIKLVKRLLGFMEAIPDIMVAFLIQLLIVYIFKQTDVLVMQFVTLGNERLYMLPMVILSFLPMVSLYRIIVLLLEEELTKQYVEFALSKGIKHNTILIIHVLRNIAKSVFFQSKIIVWALLSSLFVVEYIFNINGLSNFLLLEFRPLVVAIVLLMIFTPLFIIYQGVEIFLFKEAAISEVIVKRKKINWKQWRVWSWLNRSKQEFITHLKNPKFLFGFTIIFGMVVYSILHSIIREVPVEQFVLIYDDEGNLVSSKPHPPSEYVLLGTDGLGYSILDQLLAGAKYTILFASLIAFLRILFSFLLAIPFAMFMKERWQKIINKFVDSMHFLPLTIIAIILLGPILSGSTSGFEYSFMDRMFLEAIVLTILVVPPVTVLIGNEFKLLLDQEFIAGARVLGGDTRHILFKHLMPHLGSKMGILFGQQFIQVLIVLIHLGLFNLFLGGTSVMYDEFYRAPQHSVTFEWSGLISSTREALMTGHHWIIIPVFTAFIIVILSMQLIVEGIQEVQQARVGVTVKRSKWLTKLFRRNKTKQEQPSEQYDVQADSFRFIEPTDQSKHL